LRFVASPASIFGRLFGGSEHWRAWLLWEFQTEVSRENWGFYLNADKKLNSMMLFRSEFEANPIGVERMFTIGSIASSPLVMNGTVYFGSADGYFYALD